MIDIVKAGDLQGILGSSPVVIVDVFSKRCGPCNMVEPVIEEYQKRHADHKVLKMDFDVADNRPFMTQNKVAFVPTLLIFCCGALKESVRGYRPLAALEEAVAKAMAK
jgi:thioredoxin 1